MAEPSPARTAAASTTAARAGTHADPGLGPPLVPALHQSTVHSYRSLAELDRVFTVEDTGHVYYRFGHFNGALLEQTVAELEGAQAAACGASGMAVLTATLLGTLRPGDHVVADRNAYGGTLTLLTTDLPALGITTSLVDVADPDAVQDALTPRTRILLVEALTNPTMRVADLPALTDMGHAAGLTVVVDATFTSPALIRPLDHGADLVWHSIPKYLGGHSAAMGGVVAGRSDLIDAARTTLVHLGATLVHLGAWMALLGMKTLPLRMRAHSSNATAVAAVLAQHPAVNRVEHPSLPDHPQYGLAARLYSGGTGGMLAFELAGGRPAVEAFITAVGDAIPLAPSLADVASTLTYPAGTTHRNLDPTTQAELGITAGLIRLSVGIEDVTDIVSDITKALDVAFTTGPRGG